MQRLQLEPAPLHQVVAERSHQRRRQRLALLDQRLHDVRRERHARRAPERRDLFEDRPEHLPRLRDAAHDADGTPGERGEAGLGADEEILLPQHAPNVRRDLDGYRRGAERVPQPFAARRRPAVELAEDDAAAEAMRDDTGRLDPGEHVRRAADGVGAAEHGVDLLLVVDAVLKRHHGGLRTDRGRERRRRALGVVRLHAEEHRVGGGTAGQRLHGVDLDDALTLGHRSDPQAVTADRREMGAARHEPDGRAGERKSSAEVSPDAARTHDDDREWRHERHARGALVGCQASV